MLRLKKIAAATALVAGSLVSTSAHALITESEPNGTLAAASAISRPASTPFSDVGVSTLTAGDVDVYLLALNAGEVLTFNATPLNIAPTSASPDTAIALVNSGGTILAVNDDIGPTDFGSAIQYSVATTGNYYLAVSGTDDAAGAAVGGTFGSGNFSGAHPESGSYAITISVAQAVPEPTSLGLLGGGLLLLARRRPQRVRTA